MIAPCPLSAASSTPFSTPAVPSSRSPFSPSDLKRVITLYLPRVLGLYGIPDALHNPNEWSSLFIATAVWGGFWALAGIPVTRSPK
jgi:hypothetical protein